MFDARGGVVLNWLNRLIPEWLRFCAIKCSRLWQQILELGLVDGIGVQLKKRRATSGEVIPLDPRHAKHRLYFRHGTSDYEVFYQVFIDREYAPLADLREVGLMIDCGANVGYTSAFLLSLFPACHLIAVEPDPGNFALLERNLQAYGNRAEAIRAGIWSHSVPLKISQDRYRDGREWSIQVRPCKQNEEPDFQGISIASLLEASGYERISLLKMDIEGAEAVVFQGNLDWLDRVDAIAIELHDDSIFGNGSEIFQQAIRGHDFEISHNGELTICRRRTVATLSRQ